MRRRQYVRVKVHDPLGRRTYIVHEGGSLWSDLKKKLKRGSAKLYKMARPILLNAGKELAPIAVNAVGNKLLSEASKRGVSDNLVNLGSKANQYATKAVQDRLKPEKQGVPQQMVSNYISDRSQELLGQILGSGRRGGGLRGLGLHGVGLQGLSGRSPFNQSAPSL